MVEIDKESSGERWHAALVQTFTLLSTTAAATRVLRAVHDRRTGRDPSDQEMEHDALVGLCDSVTELQDLLLPLIVARAAGANVHPNDDRVAVVRRFDVLHRSTEATAILHRVHQRLLSLYPAIPDEVVEEARLLQQRLNDERVADEEEVVHDLANLLADVLDFALRLEPVVASIRRA